MSQRPTMRPSFTVPLRGDGRAVMEALHARLARPDAPFVGQVLKQYAFLQRPRGERSLLSPYLNLQLREAGDGRRQLFGRFSPHPAVWMGFMAVYGFLLMVAASGLMYGWAQTTVDEYPWGFWLVPGCLALLAFVYGASVIGQGLTADEMHALRRYVERALEEAGEAAAEPATDPAAVGEP